MFVCSLCCRFNRDPYIIHPNIALSMVVSFYVGEKAMFQMGKMCLLRSPVQVNLNVLMFGAFVLPYSIESPSHGIVWPWIFTHLAAEEILASLSFRVFVCVCVTMLGWSLTPSKSLTFRSRIAMVGGNTSRRRI